MSRTIPKDYASLISFLEKYTLNDKLADQDFAPLLKGIHKRYLALLTLLAEVETQANDSRLLQDPNFLQTHSYFKESISDIGSSYFCFIHGTIKPSKIMIRSSIETIIKGITANEFPNVLVSKSVFGVLDEAKKTAFFQRQIEGKLFAQLETIYGELCKDVHTATTKNMAHVSALNTFPSFDKQSSSEAKKIIIDTSRIVLAIGCIFYKNYFLKMHFENKEIVTASLDKSIKKYLNGH
ncbi:hypothetical protein [Undibacterium sp. RuTC16W]|uniref:hypothetical protein n=1 Tax=Undibacterium sp. RuTC16W TaxID=3413048 RepID=UPI003BEFEC8C